MNKAWGILAELLFLHLDLSKTKGDLLDLLGLVEHSKFIFFRVSMVVFLGSLLFVNSACFALYRNLFDNFYIHVASWAVVELSLIFVFVYYTYTKAKQLISLDKDLSEEFWTRLWCIENHWNVVTNEDIVKLNSTLNDHIAFVQGPKNEVIWLFKGKHSGIKRSFEYVIYELKYYDADKLLGAKTGIMVLGVELKDYRNTCVTNQQFEPYSLRVRHSEDEAMLKLVDVYTHSPNAVVEVMPVVSEVIPRLNDFAESIFDINDEGHITMQFEYNVTGFNKPYLIMDKCDKSYLEFDKDHSHDSIKYALEYVEDMMAMQRSSQPTLKAI